MSNPTVPQYISISPGDTTKEFDPSISGVPVLTHTGQLVTDQTKLDNTVLAAAAANPPITLAFSASAPAAGAVDAPSRPWLRFDGAQTLTAAQARQARANLGSPVPLTKTANYALALTDEIVAFNAASLTATLPDPTLVVPGKIYRIKNVNASALTVASAGSSKTIDGSATVSQAQWVGKGYYSNGAAWLSV